MKRLLTLALVLALVAVFPGEVLAKDGLKVVTSTTDLADIVKQVGGNHVSVESIGHPGQNAHSIEVNPRYMVKIGKADVYVKVGLDLDLWADYLAEGARNPDLTIVDASHGITPAEKPSVKLDPSHGDIHIYGNPHYLLDPENAKIAAANVVEGLKAKAPEFGAEFDANLSSFQTKISALTDKLMAQMKSFEGTRVVTYHKSWVYFLNRYGLVEVGNVEPKPGLTPSAGHISSLVATMKANKIKVVIFEGYNDRKFVDTVCRETGAKPVELTGSVGSPSSAADLIKMHEFNVAALLAGLR